MFLLGQFILLVGLIVVNAFFVLAEFVAISVPVVQLEQIRDEHRWARDMYEVLNDSRRRDHYIVVAQLGVTFASLLLGVCSEQTLATLFVAFAEKYNICLSFVSVTAIASLLSLVVITYLHVVLGEMVPKRLAIDNPLRYARLIDAPMRWCGRLFSPLVWLLNDLISNSILRFFNLPISFEAETYSPEDLRLAFDESNEGGELEDKYNDWCQNLLEMSERTLRQVMVARVKVKGISKNSTVEEALAIAKTEGYSRYPIYDGDLDHIVGQIHVRDLFQARWQDRNVTMDELKRHCERLPESLELNVALDQMRAKRWHMVAVVDEFGGIAGIVSMEDIIEAIFGEVFDEFDSDEDAPIKADTANGEGYWLVEGSVILEDLSTAVDVDIEREEVYTVGGLVMDQLDRLPKVGDTVTIEEGLTIEVVKVEDMVPALCRIHMIANRKEDRDESI